MEVSILDKDEDQDDGGAADGDVTIVVATVQPCL
jgi:hypothetical protein